MQPDASGAQSHHFTASQLVPVSRAFQRFFFVISMLIVINFWLAFFLHQPICIHVLTNKLFFLKLHISSSVSFDNVRIGHRHKHRHGHTLWFHISWYFFTSLFFFLLRIDPTKDATARAERNRWLPFHRCLAPNINGLFIHWWFEMAFLSNRTNLFEQIMIESMLPLLLFSYLVYSSIFCSFLRCFDWCSPFRTGKVLFVPAFVLPISYSIYVTTYNSQLISNWPWKCLFHRTLMSFFAHSENF